MSVYHITTSAKKLKDVKTPESGVSNNTIHLKYACYKSYVAFRHEHRKDEQGKRFENGPIEWCQLWGWCIQGKWRAHGKVVCWSHLFVLTNHLYIHTREDLEFHSFLLRNAFLRSANMADQWLQSLSTANTLHQRPIHCIIKPEFIYILGSSPAVAGRSSVYWVCKLCVKMLQRPMWSGLGSEAENRALDKAGNSLKVTTKKKPLFFIFPNQGEHFLRLFVKVWVSRMSL